MPVIDVQVHPFDRNHPDAGRGPVLARSRTPATGEEMVAAMNRVGVDGAIMDARRSAPMNTIRATRSKFTAPIRTSFGW